MVPIDKGKGLDEFVSEIRANLDSVKDVMKLQNHFFKVHENTLFNKLDIEVQEYYEEDILDQQALYNFANKNLIKDNFIYVTMQFDQDKESKAGVEKECYSMLDLYLVYLHTFLYLLNYYGMAQTSPDYSKALDLPASLSGVLQAASPAAAIFFGFVINCITKTKYRFPYLLCLCMLFVGNFLYFISIAIFEKSQTWALVSLIAGRMIFGSGGSRLMTRKFIAINVPSIYQSKYSTYLVGFSALGITLGPGISSILEFVKPVSFTVGKLTFQIQTYNILSLVFFLVWLFLFFFFMIFFKGYDVIVEKNLEKMYENEEKLHRKFVNLNEYYKHKGSRSMQQNLKLIKMNRQNFLASGLLVNPTFNVQEKNLVNSDGYKIFVPGNTIKNTRSRTSFSATFPNLITWYSLWCFLIFKIIQEAYFTEQPQMFDEYWGYKSQIVGWFMLSLTLVGVPTALLTGAATKKFEDRKILLIGFILYIIGCLGKINYEIDQPQPFVQYIIASVVLFIASLVAESAAISILAKVISPSLKLGFFNAGLLSGTADTIGRALGNSSMTLFGSIT
jgi:MFS family permease